jgi:hypothetical protein
MNVITKFIAILSVFLLFVLACRSDAPKEVDLRHPAAEQPLSPDSVFLIVEYSLQRTDTSRMFLTAPDSLTVLGVLQAVTKRDSVFLQTRSYAIGVMVEQIGDRKNGEGGYWLYTVNGEPIPQAVSAYRVSAGDTVRFFFNER